MFFGKGKSMIRFKNGDELNAYIDGRLDELSKGAAGNGMAGLDEVALEASFLMDYVYEPVSAIIRDMSVLDMPNCLTISKFLQMQKVVMGIFPYWVDNDVLFEKGRGVLDVLSLIGEDVRSQRELDAWIGKRADDYLKCEGVSVILPSYNGQKYIGDAIRSVLSQTYGRLELIIVDDASEGDGIEKIARSFNDGRVRYIRNEKNGGIARSRNVGIRAAKYPFVAFCDDDDTLRADKLEKQLIAYAKGGGGFTYCEMHYHRINGEEDLFVPRRDICRIRKEGYIYPELLRRNMIGGPTLLLKKECFEKVGYFNEDMRIFEDWEMALRLAREFDAIFVAEPLYDYYERPGSLTTRRDEEYYDFVRETLREFNGYVNAERRKYGLDVADIF